jgi:hypothetical protein
MMSVARIGSEDHYYQAAHNIAQWEDTPEVYETLAAFTVSHTHTPLNKSMLGAGSRNMDGATAIYLISDNPSEELLAELFRLSLRECHVVCFVPQTGDISAQKTKEDIPSGKNFSVVAVTDFDNIANDIAGCL